MTQCCILSSGYIVLILQDQPPRFHGAAFYTNEPRWLKTHAGSFPSIQRPALGMVLQTIVYPTSGSLKHMPWQGR
jgi:hypothetical protein